ncbi:MAG: hydantoinase B/oxoprolinase family protein, partial [Terriglobales bacterium]
MAVGNIANAIKQISVQRGHDVTEYVLSTFGGAGGQHACLVADKLGMRRVFIHSLAGVLSAYGMGLAHQSVMREESVEVTLADNIRSELAARFDKLSQQASSELRKQGVAAERIDTLRHVHLRYQGTDHALLVPFDAVDAMRAAFEAAYRQRYAFLMPDRALIVEAISVEVLGAADSPKESFDQPAPRQGEVRPVVKTRLFSGGAWRETDLFRREDMRPGDVIRGPAIIAEAVTTTVVEAGWQAEVTAFNHLLLTRIEKLPQRRAIGTTADPVLLEVFNNLFMSIAEQMGLRLQNTAYSVNIKERLDFSCAIFDAHGNLIANAPHMPVHLGSMGESIKTVMRANAGTMKPGDAYALNDPYQGGTHLPDITVVTPVFDEADEKILFYVGSRGHHADVGGITPGSVPPDSKTIDQEGVRISNWKLVENARLREAETIELLLSGPYPSRNPQQNIADLRAQVAANE